MVLCLSQLLSSFEISALFIELNEQSSCVSVSSDRYNKLSLTWWFQQQIFSHSFKTELLRGPCRWLTKNSLFTLSWETGGDTEIRRLDQGEKLWWGPTLSFLNSFNYFWQGLVLPSAFRVSEDVFGDTDTAQSTKSWHITWGIILISEFYVLELLILVKMMPKESTQC